MLEYETALITHNLHVSTILHITHSFRRPQADEETPNKQNNLYMSPVFVTTIYL